MRLLAKIGRMVSNGDSEFLPRTSWYFFNAEGAEVSQRAQRRRGTGAFGGERTSLLPRDRYFTRVDWMCRFLHRAMHKMSPVRPLRNLCVLCVKKLTNSDSRACLGVAHPPVVAFFVFHFAFCLAMSPFVGEVVAESPIETAQRRVVKIYGAGGATGLEAYQTGVLISPEGHVLTAWTYVLDTATVMAYLHDGRRLEAKLVGADPKLEIAVLKIDVRDVPYFDLAKSPPLEKIEVGTRVFAASNLYNVATGDEPASVQRGVIAAKASLSARRGSYRTPYTGSVLVIDAVTNNPGAAGGALVDARGQLLGVLGKELRSQDTNAWLNYALPAAEIQSAVADLAAGRGPRRTTEKTKLPEQPHTLSALGIVLVPDALPRTPPYVDRVRESSPAATAGIRADDLVIMIDDQLTSSCRAVTDGLKQVDRADALKLALMRGDELIEVNLKAEENR